MAAVVREEASHALDADDKHERRVRLLHLSKGAVLAHRFTVHSLLRWTTTTSAV